MTTHETLEASIARVEENAHAGDHVVICWVFRFEWQDGTVTELEELAYQHGQGERIAQEQFFYD
jgi:hypothetical protein